MILDLKPVIAVGFLHTSMNENYSNGKKGGEFYIEQRQNFCLSEIEEEYDELANSYW